MTKLIIILLFIHPFFTYGESLSRDILVISSIKETIGNPKLKKTINDHYKSILENNGIHVHIKHELNAEEIAKELSSSKYGSIFYIGHGGFRPKYSFFGRPESGIFDIDGNNIKYLFQGVSSSLKYLSVIGCSSSKVLENITPKRSNLDKVKKYLLKGNRELHSLIRSSIEDFSKFADANYYELSLFESGNCNDDFLCGRSKLIYNQNYLDSTSFSQRKSDSFEVQTINENEASAILRLGNHYVGFLSDKKEEQVFYIPRHLLENNTLDLTVEYLEQKSEKKLPLQLYNEYLDFEVVKNPITNQTFGLRKNFYKLKKQNTCDEKKFENYFKICN